MRLFTKLALTSSMTMWSIASASAFGHFYKVHSTPEIDGAAGISAIAVLISAGILAYDRLKS